MIYFDNASTTQVSEEAAKKAYEVMTEQYGNPSSVHDFGYEAEKILKLSRKTILDCLGSQNRTDDLIFTSGGTEANNLAVFGFLSAHRRGGKTVFFSDSEHASNYAISKELASQGYKVKYIPTSGGSLDLGFCEREFCSDTALISCMYANNETGAKYDILADSELRRKLCPDAVLHTDGVQAFGKTYEKLCSCGADLISISGHKIHAPKGVGGLFIRSGLRINGIILGGGQEKDIRPGTEPLPNIAAFATACKESFNIEKINKVESLKNDLLDKIRIMLPSVKINSPENCIPHVVSLSLPGIKSEVMLRYLSAKQIYVSAGSACSSKHRENRVLTAFGLDPKTADCTIRISFSDYNKAEEIDIFINELSNGINSLIALK